MADLDARKVAAAEAAATLVEDGMVVGLGSGSTASLAVAAIGKRTAQGLRIVGVRTSEKTAEQARSLGIPLSLAECETIDLTIDSADEIEHGSLDVVKGLGGALLREKFCNRQPAAGNRRRRRQTGQPHRLRRPFHSG